MVQLDGPQRRDAAENNTAMSWDDIQNAFKQEKAFAYHHGIWDDGWMLGDPNGATWPTDEQGYFHKIGWIHAPAGEKGGKPANLSHPIVYVVNPKSAHADLAAQLIAIATLPYYNVAARRRELSPRRPERRAEPCRPTRRPGRWRRRGACCPNTRPSCRTTRTSASTTASSSRRLQGVETGRLTPQDAVAFLEDEMT